MSPSSGYFQHRAQQGRKVVLLGPQRPDFDVADTLKELGIRGAVALVTAGWQEREPDDTALVAALARVDVQAVNLKLHARAEDVFKRDTELATAYMARQKLLRDLQSFYRIRLDKAGEAAHSISVRHVEPDLLRDESKISIDLFRHLDRDHLARCKVIHASFEDRWRLPERDAVAKHRKELAASLGAAQALVIAGGHVASLLNRLKLFDVLELATNMHVIGWSAGAMVLTEKIVLFHDFPPYGTDIAQVLDAGFGVAPNVVVLPDPRRRLRMDDHDGIARFAQRMAPAKCVAMDHGTRMIFENGRLVRGAAARLTASGDFNDAWTKV